MKRYTPPICKLLERKALEEQIMAEEGSAESDLRRIAKAECIGLRRAASIIDESNALLRSFHEIAKRDGKDTCWPEVRRILDKELKRQNAKPPRILAL